MKISKLSDIKGLGPKSIDYFKNLNINNIDDLVIIIHIDMILLF